MGISTHNRISNPGAYFTCNTCNWYRRFVHVKVQVYYYNNNHVVIIVVLNHVTLEQRVESAQIPDARKNCLDNARVETIPSISISLCCNIMHGLK